MAVDISEFGLLCPLLSVDRFGDRDCGSRDRWQFDGWRLRTDDFGQSGDGTLGRDGDGDRYQLFIPGGYDP